MASTITLTALNGRLTGKTFEFENADKITIGRANDCEFHLGSEPEFQMTSRHHCVLHEEPTGVCVHDLGSRNGTYLNGMQIGRPEWWHLSRQLTAQPCHDYVLRDGDELRLGHTAFRVGLATQGDEPGSDEFAVVTEIVSADQPEVLWEAAQGLPASIINGVSGPLAL